MVPARSHFRRLFILWVSANMVPILLLTVVPSLMAPSIRSYSVMKKVPLQVPMNPGKDILKWQTGGLFFWMKLQNCLSLRRWGCSGYLKQGSLSGWVLPRWLKRMSESLLPRTLMLPRQLKSASSGRTCSIGSIQCLFRSRPLGREAMTFYFCFVNLQQISQNVIACLPFGSKKKRARYW